MTGPRLTRRGQLVGALTLLAIGFLALPVAVFLIRHILRGDGVWLLTVVAVVALVLRMASRVEP